MIFFLLFILLFMPLSISAKDIKINDIEVIGQSEGEENLDDISSFTRIIKVKDEYNKKVTDLLEESGVVTVLSTGSDSGVTTISIRGSSSKQVLILLDGIPIDSSDSQFDINMIPLSSVDGIEVSRGGSSALYGGKAMGGVINIKTKKGSDTSGSINMNLKPGQKVGGNVSLNFSKKFFSFIGIVDGLYNNGEYLYLYDNGTPNFKDDDYMTYRINNDVWKMNSFFDFSFSLPKDMKIDFKFNESFKDNGVSGPTYSIEYETTRLQRLFLSGNLKFDFGNLNGYFTADILSYYKFDYFNYTRDKSDLFIALDDKSYSNFFGTSTTFDFFSIPYNNIVATFDINGEFLDSDYYREKLQKIAFSFSIKDDILLLDEKLGFMPSFRLDWDNIFNVNLSGKIGLFYEFAPNFKLKHNLFTSFRNPDFMELYFSYGTVVGNEDLKTEYAFGGDVGVLYNTQDFLLEATVFVEFFHNLIAYTISRGFIFKPQNLDDNLSLGFEGRMRFRPLSFLHFELNYTFNYVFDVNEDSIYYLEQKISQPLHKFSFLLEFPFKYINFGTKAYIESWMNIGGGGDKPNYYSMIKVGSNNIIDGYLLGTKIIPAKVMIDCFIKLYLFSPITRFKAEIYINFNNILNRYSYDYRNYPLEGFNIETGFTIKF